jgi:hypothetical protein
MNHTGQYETFALPAHATIAVPIDSIHAQGTRLLPTLYPLSTMILTQ